MIRTFAFILAISLLPWAVAAQDVQRVKIADLQAYLDSSDHPVLVSFWATWCLPCLHEIPWLQQSIEKYADQKPELLLVSLDFPDAYPARLTSFIKKQGYKARFFWLDETDADHFCPLIDPKWTGGIPANLFVNPATGYRKFIGRQLTDRQADLEVKLMTGQ